MRSRGWGKVFTDHMITIRYAPGRGWHEATLSVYRPLSLNPSASVLNYGQSIYEGLKAYRQPDGSVATFRPDMNAARFIRSAHRIAMPELPVDLFLESLRLLVTQDRYWVPSRAGESLYLRPLMLATDEALGVRPSGEYLFVLYASPVGDYYPGGVNPMSVWLCRDYIRAASGGTGEAKFAGNYAAAMLAQREAAEQGCDQVVWLDADRRQTVEEMGGMNLFFVTSDDRLLTPALTGTLLAGVTRDSILTLGRDLGLKVEERAITVDEWRSGAETGAITEVFACGTAVVVTPVGEVKSADGTFRIADGTPGEVTMTLRESLLAIQQGTADDRYGWRYSLCAR